jgi:hypothetical protein
MRTGHQELNETVHNTEAKPKGRKRTFEWAGSGYERGAKVDGAATRGEDGGPLSLLDRTVL